MRGRIQSIVLLVLMAICVNSQCVARCLSGSAQKVSHDMPCHKHSSSKTPDCDHSQTKWADAEVAPEISKATPVHSDQLPFVSTFTLHLIPYSIAIDSRDSSAPPGSPGTARFLSTSVLRI